MLWLGFLACAATLCGRRSAALRLFALVACDVVSLGSVFVFLVRSVVSLWRVFVLWYLWVCAMPVAKSLPVTVEAAFTMDMGRFIGAINEGFEGNTAEVVVEPLESNFIRSNRRLASTPVSCFLVGSLW